LLAERERLLAEIARRADIAGEIAEVLRESHALGDRHRALDPGIALRDLGTPRHVERDLLERGLPRALLALQAIEAIEAVHHGEHRLLGLPCGIAPLHRELRERDRRIRRARRAERLHGRAERRAEG